MMAGAAGAVAAACAAVAGGALGWFAVPRASDAALRRALGRADAWWDDSLRAYRAFKQEHPSDEPASSAPGAVGALGLWREDALASALAGELTEERLGLLSEAGLKVGGPPAAGTEKERRRRFSFRATRRQRAVCACAMAVAGAVCTAAPNAAAAVALGACFFAMAVTVACDLRARTIPLEPCALLALAGAVFQMAARGLEGAAAGLAFAAAVLVGAAAANRLLRLRCPRGAVGRGDMRCMGALAVASGAGAACGFAACYVLAGVVALAGCAARRLSWGDGLPMAPFLAVWLACGAALSILPP